jgi:hypothetical protein
MINGPASLVKKHAAIFRLKAGSWQTYSNLLVPTPRCHSKVAPHTMVFNMVRAAVPRHHLNLVGLNGSGNEILSKRGEF